MTAAGSSHGTARPYPGNAVTLLDVVHHGGYTIPMPPGHPFPMAKFDRLRARLNDGPNRFHDAPLATRAQLESVHDADYLDALANGHLYQSGQRRSGFTCNAALLERCRRETGGTCRTVELALAHGLACNAAGGTHHAHRDFASGYCLINDLAVAVHHARTLGVRRILILDCDVHQGDGTARLLADDAEAVTVSLHCAENFPHRKAISDHDIAAPRGCDDAGYIDLLATHVPTLLDRHAPELVLYDAGVDVHADDRLGHLGLTTPGLRARDRWVIDCVRTGGIALAGVIGGGYDRDLDALVERHAQLFIAASEHLCAHRCN